MTTPHPERGQRMGTHRKQQHYRRIVVAAVAVGAVAVPSTALACNGGPSAPGGSPSHGAGSGPGGAGGLRSGGLGVFQPGGPGWGRHGGHSFPTGPGAPASQADPAAPAQPSAPDAGAPAQPSAPDAGAPAQPSAPDAGAPTQPSAPDASAPSEPAASKDTSASSQATARAVELVNSERAKVGCSALTVNDKLTKAAQAHSEDMASHQNMSHTGSDGSNPGDRITRAGYGWQSYGENVAYGYDTPEQVMAGWMSSAGHKANILNCSFKEIGVGLAQPGNYWTQDFGAGR
ncbi:CAP domain-containing protein [Streptomyces sp. NPDC088816]|uniref:CAP domain-containing protein n=1 Tax=Streptomyces sp. NPDC088816 TaxID=3365906 RepID=UPI003815D1F3